MTAVEIHRTPTVPAGEWSLISQQADFLARSDIIPKAYQRKPANVVVAAITGRQYGWDVLTAMRNGHVIEGTWGMKPEAMLGLVRRSGHSVKGEMNADGATVTGVRADTGDTMTITFTIADAVTARLVQLKDGKPFARSSSGKPLPWEQYPSMMCYWRAVGLLCRVLFSDITAGVYSAEELGAAIGEDGDVLDVTVIDPPAPTEPVPLSQEALDKFAEACEQVGELPADVLAEAFPDGVPEELTDEHLPRMRDAYRAIVERNAKEDAGDGEQQLGGAEPPVGGRPASRNQVGKIKGEYERLGFDRDRQLAYTATLINHPVDSHNALTHDEATLVIEHLVGL